VKHSNPNGGSRERHPEWYAAEGERRARTPASPQAASTLQQLTDLTKGETMSVWTILFIILLIAWIGGFTVFHVAGGLIHLLLVFAVISLILHFVLGTRAA
jgi:Family of unknown function (DUF5670)